MSTSKNDGSKTTVGGDMIGSKRIPPHTVIPIAGAFMIPPASIPRCVEISFEWRILFLFLSLTRLASPQRTIVTASLFLETKSYARLLHPSMLGLDFVPPARLDFSTTPGCPFSTLSIPGLF